LTEYERRDIGARLENWARVYRPGRTIGVSATAAFCDQLKREALGEGATGERRKVDEVDAHAIEQAMRHLTPRDRLMLKLCYIEQREPHIVCRRLGIAHRPATVFVTAFRQAQAALEAALGSSENFHDAQNFLTTGNLSSKFRSTT
jgi:hypothetical protein